MVTATYNSSKTLRLSLASMLAQDFGDFEVLIVGDGCTDDSCAVVESFQDRRFLWTNLATNSGNQAAPNNAGLARARGEYIAYLGHDDLWLPWHLSGLLGAIETSHADLVHATVAMIWPDRITVAGPPGDSDDPADRWIAPSSILHRKTTGLACGGWIDPEHGAVGVDRDFIKRFAASGGRLQLHPELGVLKFPSAGWRMYDLPGDPPQSSYLARMMADPRHLEREILNRIATEFGATQGIGNVGDSLAALIASVRRRLIRFYGRDTWPMSRLLLWNHRRWRRRARKLRGLQKGGDGTSV